MQTQESIALFQQLKKKFGTHNAAANALCIPRRTYSDWMARGFSTERKWLPALSHMRALLNDTLPPRRAISETARDSPSPGAVPGHQ